MNMEFAKLWGGELTVMGGGWQVEVLNARTQSLEFYRTREVSKPEPELCVCECERMEMALQSHGRRGWFKKIGLMW